MFREVVARVAAPIAGSFAAFAMLAVAASADGPPPPAPALPGSYVADAAGAAAVASVQNAFLGNACVSREALHIDRLEVTIPPFDTEIATNQQSKFPAPSYVVHVTTASLRATLTESYVHCPVDQAHPQRDRGPVKSRLRFILQSGTYDTSTGKVALWFGADPATKYAKSDARFAGVFTRSSQAGTVTVTRVDGPDAATNWHADVAEALQPVTIGSYDAAKVVTHPLNELAVRTYDVDARGIVERGKSPLRVPRDRRWIARRVVAQTAYRCTEVVVKTLGRDAVLYGVLPAPGQPNATLPTGASAFAKPGERCRITIASYAIR